MSAWEGGCEIAKSARLPGRGTAALRLRAERRRCWEGRRAGWSGTVEEIRWFGLGEAVGGVCASVFCAGYAWDAGNVEIMWEYIVQIIL